MIPQTPKHDLLRSLHELIKPKSYLEIGVQTGRSLVQARPGTVSVGVDPHPQLELLRDTPILNPYSVHKMTSDEFFASPLVKTYAPYDFVFIDGLHLIEQVMRDFSNAMKWSRPDGRTIIAVDDVLPYSVEIASRQPLLGDWTGDVWKIYSILSAHAHPDTTLLLVDVAPTGLLIILDVDPDEDPMTVDTILQDDDVLTQFELDELRSYALTPENALHEVATFLNRRGE